jgi:cytochrome c oxidase cbb3-type subunit 4
MELYSTLSSLFTVVSFLVFLGIVAWAYGRGRKEAFAEAANEPFALPDENAAGANLFARSDQTGGRGPNEFGPTKSDAVVGANSFARGDRVDRARER